MKRVLLILVFLLSACEKKPVTVTQTVEVPTATATATATPAVHATATPEPTPSIVVTIASPPADLEIRPEWTARLDKVIAGIARDKDRYLAIQDMRKGGMPWFFIGGLHERESSRDFTKHLHEGSPLLYRTRYIPKNRLPNKPPPYTWEASSEDALYILKREDKVDWTDTDKAIYAIIAYNGWGYAKYHPEVESPYAYSGSTRYARGKYVADGRFDPLAVDKQPGVITLWARMEKRGLLSE